MSLGVPTCTISPGFMTPMRVDSVIASSWSCVTTTKVTPSCSCRFTSSNCVCSRSFLSSAPSGSSSSSSFGRLTSERASATRCRWPPESWCGLRFANCDSFTRFQHVGDARDDLRRRHAVLLQAEGDVLLHRHVRKQRVGLEHHVHRALVRRNARHVDAVDEDLAAGRLFEAGQHAQQRGLAAARAAEQAEQLAACRSSAKRR